MKISRPVMRSEAPHNAGPEPRLEAGARHERTLEGVGSRPSLGGFTASDVRHDKTVALIEGSLVRRCP
jgi:hypothetical protein